MTFWITSGVWGRTRFPDLLPAPKFARNVLFIQARFQYFAFLS